LGFFIFVVKGTPVTNIKNMSVIVKFIVANEDNAHKVSAMAKQHYAKVTKQEDTDKKYSVSAFLNRANSFTREWLMAFEVTGEDDDRQEEPLAFIELLSANIPEEANSGKPLYIEKAIHTESQEGLEKVLNRALEIALQRRHDSVWAEFPETDAAVKKLFTDSGFAATGKREGVQLFKKTL
jgi:hypothetical protein